MPASFTQHPNLKSFSSIPPKPLDWLWHLRIPKGKLTLLAGDPATGKTSLLLDLASRLSRGEPMPPTPATTITTNTTTTTHSPTPLTTDHSPLTTPRATLLLSPEDNRADTLRPKLDRLHANLQHIHTLDHFHSLLPDTTPASPGETPPSPMDILTNACSAIPNLALLIIDPITYYLGLTDRIQKKSKAHGSQSMGSSSPNHRTLLAQLAHLAESQNIAIILTTRLQKKIPDDGLTLASLRRALGSLAFTAAARSVLLTLPTSQPQSPPFPTARANVLPFATNLPPTNSPTTTTTTTPPSHLLLSIKSNLSAPPPPLAFTLTDRIAWQPDPASFPDSPPAKKRPTEPLFNPNSFVSDAAEFLQQFLKDGPQRATRIQSSALQLGISPSSLRRARILLRLPCRFSRKLRAWFLCLPNDTRPIPSEMQELENEMRISTNSDLLSFISTQEAHL